MGQGAEGKETQERPGLEGLPHDIKDILILLITYLLMLLFLFYYKPWSITEEFYLKSKNLQGKNICNILLFFST